MMNTIRGITCSVFAASRELDNHEPHVRVGVHDDIRVKSLDAYGKVRGSTTEIGR